MNIYDTVKDIIVEELAVEPHEVKTDSRLIEDLGADSLDVIELVMAVEEKFDIEIPDQRIDYIDTVQDMVNTIDKMI